MKKEEAFVDMIERIQSLLPEGSVVGAALTKQPITVVVMACRSEEGISYLLLVSHSRPELDPQSGWYSPSSPSH